MMMNIMVTKTMMVMPWDDHFNDCDDYDYNGDNDEDNGDYDDNDDNDDDDDDHDDNDDHDDDDDNSGGGEH